MIHVGGEYKDKFGNMFLMGSYGCFGINGGNQETKRFINDISIRRSKNANKAINIIIYKRPYLERRIIVDSDGNKTTKGL